MQHWFDILMKWSVLCLIINYVSTVRCDRTNDLKIVINDVLGKVFWSLQRRPIVLFALFCTFFRWELKSNLVSNTIPRCLWVDDYLSKFWLKYNGEWSILLIFLLKITSWACLLGSGLNLIFLWKAQLLIFVKSLFKSFAVAFILWITKKRGVSSANNLGFEVKPSDKSLIWIRKNHGSRIDPWGTPASILVQDECCPFKTTLFFLWYKE